jgi:hypothetical protein
LALGGPPEGAPSSTQDFPTTHGDPHGSISCAQRAGNSTVSALKADPRSDDTVLVGKASFTRTSRLLPWLDPWQERVTDRRRVDQQLAGPSRAKVIMNASAKLHGSREPHASGVQSFGRRSLGWIAVFALVLGAVGAIVLCDQQLGGAATSGWYVAATPGTGADDVMLGSACPNASECFATGVTISNISGNNSTFVPIVERWNGSSWSLSSAALPAGEGGGIFDVSCVTGADCWGVGTVIDETSGNGNPSGTLVEHWDGNSWSIVPSPNPSGASVAGALLQSVSCSSSTSCMAVGYASDNTGAALTDLIEDWNGSSWSIVPGAQTGQAFDQLSRVDCLSPGNCWAVGNAGPAQQEPNFLPIFPAAAGNQGLIEHWDGSNWSMVPSTVEPGSAGGYLYGIDCSNNSDCWASGSITDPTGQASGIMMEHWDGDGWTDVSTSVPQPNQSGGAILSSISCLSWSQCWAVGSYGSFGGNGFNPKGFIEYWNGSAWSIEPSPNDTALSYLNSVSCLSGVGCAAIGTSATGAGSNNDPGFAPYIEQLSFPPASSQGVVLGAQDGGVFAYGTVPFQGSMGGRHLNAPVVGLAATPDGQGYWLVARDGGVFAFGDATFFGSMGGQHLNRPIVGLAATSDGRGYWLVASDGGVFAFGDAVFAGSMGGQRLNAPVVGMASNGLGGYWLVAADGGLFSFGGARFFGSTGGTRLVAPVSGIAATVDGQGYWLVGMDGGVFTYGDAGYLGSAPGQGITGLSGVVGIARTPTGSGYWLVGANGAVYAYGDASFLGAPNAGHLIGPVVAIGAG